MPIRGSLMRRMVRRICLMTLVSLMLVAVGESIVVVDLRDVDLPTVLAVQVCVGLLNRDTNNDTVRCRQLLSTMPRRARPS